MVLGGATSEAEDIFPGTELTREEIRMMLFIAGGQLNSGTMTAAQKMEHWEMEYRFHVLIHEPDVRRLLLSLAVKLPANSVIVDSGAHIGDSGIPLAQGLRDAGRSDVHVLMIEPDASKVAWIAKKIAQLGNVQASVVNSGLYSTTTRANILRSEAHPGAWVILPNVADGEVQLRSVADILAVERPKDVFGLWHLDVEGTELHALKGLGVHRPRYIMMEIVHNSNEAQNYLRLLGYKSVHQVGQDALFELQN